MMDAARRVAPIVAIDGPAGAGKSSVARAVASRLGLTLVDTGAIYRCVALAASRSGLALDDDEAVGALLSRLEVGFEEERNGQGGQRVVLAGEDVSEAIRTPSISRGASIVAALPSVRRGLLGLQRKLALTAPKGAVIEGRDIGTVVFPDAPLKFFVTASDEVRAARRHAELTARGIEATLQGVLAEQRNRDRDDSSRSLSPLRAAPDARILDTSGLTLEAVIDRILVEARSLF